MEVWKDYIFTENYRRPFGNKEVWLGYDPSYSGDRSALEIIAPPKVEGGKFRLLEYKTFLGSDFQEQILTMCDRYNVTRLAIDITGLGVGIFEIMKRQRADAIGLHYDVSLKNRMVLKGQSIITKGRFEYDDLHGIEIATSFMSIKK